MTIIQIDLPEATAEAARQAGLLTPAALDRLSNIGGSCVIGARWSCRQN